MSDVTVFLPIYEGGHKVEELQVEVVPAYDEAINWDNPLLASDVFFIGFDRKRHAFSDERKAEIMDQIRREQPDLWREIREEADASLKEECDEYREPVQFDATAMGLR